MTRDSSYRSLVKTISWRIIGTASTFAISYFILGNLLVSGTIATIQLTANTILYFLHERIWNSITWGKK